MQNKIIVFDTETTGLLMHPDAPLSKQPKIIQFGAVLLNEHGVVVEELSEMINPGEAISDEITKITGITNQELRFAPGFTQVFPRIKNMFDKSFAVFAHNLPFDKAMLFNELERHNIIGFPWPKQEYCTAGMHKDFWGRNPKLIKLYEATMGMPLAQTHRALDDVMALVEIIVALNLHKIAYDEEK